MHIHINVSSNSIFLVWKRNCGTAEIQVAEYSVCEGGTTDLKQKLTCVSGTAERQDAVYFLCGSGTTKLLTLVQSNCV